MDGLRDLVSSAEKAADAGFDKTAGLMAWISDGMLDAYASAKERTQV